MSRESRRVCIRALLEERGLDAVLLRRPANFAWYTNGADNRVDHSSPVGVAYVVATRDREFVFTTNIEARRMKEEETPDFEVVEYPWYEDGPRVLRDMLPGRIGADGADPDFDDVGDAVVPLRWVLDDEALARYPDVGRDAQRALADAAATLEPGMSEFDAAGAIADACRRANLSAPVILAAADERLATFRHPLPMGHRARRCFMLVLCAERGGLFANLTQFVHFEEPDPDVRSRFDACIRILDRAREATQPGRTLADVLADIQRFYAEEGFPEEWKLHHQGGMTGYASREVVATPSTDIPIEIGQAFAWNPSIRGAKAEETFVLTENGPVILARGRLLP